MNTTVPNNKITGDQFSAAESNNLVNAINSKGDDVANHNGTALVFTQEANYGTVDDPETGNITADVTNAKAGMTVLLVHNNGSAPTFDAKFKKMTGSGDYVTGSLNYIFCIFLNATTILYSINQSA